MSGDEIKQIDWKALARSDRYHVKEFEEETTQKIYILLDSSVSMGYHKKGSLTKYRYGVYLLSSLEFIIAEPA